MFLSSFYGIICTRGLIEYKQYNTSNRIKIDEHRKGHKLANREKILPCPHCGGQAYLNSNYSYKTRSYFVFVKCDICGAQGKIFNSEDAPAAADWDNEACVGAVDAWNMRTDQKREEEQ